MSIDNYVKVIAEVWNADSQDAYLLGDDMNLYRTHKMYQPQAVNGHTDPFNQGAKNQVLSDNEMIGKILKYSVVTTREGDTYLKGNYNLEMALNDN